MTSNVVVCGDALICGFGLPYQILSKNMGTSLESAECITVVDQQPFDPAAECGVQVWCNCPSRAIGVQIRQNGDSCSPAANDPAPTELITGTCRTFDPCRFPFAVEAQLVGDAAFDNCCPMC
eukprot:CAMPEP_0114660912 /NCGR_PEP_ID=MMETSP0191-20121206/21245_1 /TAXON_ID=126664 /ORGANISM="Sorites sp." /LENGTH=121 /DNA_ID=CAMNT_0001891455 /DNA_START=159 /DNA_END=524 /DNA_ORIENTATION=-